jgi:hypothetical protein
MPSSEIKIGSLTFKPADENRHLFGLSPKGLYTTTNTDGETVTYYIKEPKARKVADIFGKTPHFVELIATRQQLLKEVKVDVKFDPYTEQPDKNLQEYLSDHDFQLYQENAEKIEKYAQHVREIVLSNTTLEILAPQLAQAIFGKELLSVPENIFFMGSKGTPCTASQSVGQLSEFLTEHPSVESKQSPADWKKEGVTPPTFEDLIVSENNDDALLKAQFLGQAFAIALLMGHLDLVNNINLSNFGTIISPDTQQEKLCIVDWGNCLGAGFSGLSADEGAFQNPRFNTQIEPQDPITGFSHVVPFDGEILPALPRQVVGNLFDLTAEDNKELREAQRKGFFQAFDQASKNKENLITLVTETIAQTINAVPEADRETFKQALPVSARLASQTTNPDSLAQILTHRLNSLESICTKLQNKQCLTDIIREQNERLVASQNYKAGLTVIKDLASSGTPSSSSDMPSSSPQSTPSR